MSDSRIKRIAKEPLLHFPLLGAAIFGLYGYLGAEGDAPSDDVIEITQNDLQRLQAQFQKSWGRPPSESEIEALISHYVREEVLVREAIDLKLDNNDSVIRNRLRQKMEFIAASVTGSMQPSDEELAAFYEENRQSFLTPPKVAFRQYYVGDDLDTALIEETLAVLRSGKEPAAAPALSLLPAEVSLAAYSQIDGTFGAGFSAALDELPVGEWAGPVRSGYGHHLVIVTSKEPAELPDLETIRPKVVSEWQAQMRTELQEAYVKALEAKYRVEVAPSPTGGEG